MENESSYIDTGYDICTSQFSPNGRIFQVEYAQKAVENGTTAIGLRGKDGVVLAAQNIISKLYEIGTNRKIFTIDNGIGVAVTGFMADSRHIVATASEHAASYRIQYNQPTPIKYLKNNMSMYMHAYTQYSGFRPFGASVIIGAYESNEAQMYYINPSGKSCGYFGCAIGRAKQAAITVMENIDLKNSSITTLVKEAARIIYTVHEGEDFALELSWVGKITGGRHMFVPSRVLKEAKEYAKFVLQDEDSASEL